MERWRGKKNDSKGEMAALFYQEVALNVGAGCGILSLEARTAVCVLSMDMGRGV